jgi:large subunit ribosomal protein L25
MAEKVTVKAEIREARGSNDARRLRRDGKVPVSVYGGGQDTVSAIAEIGDLAAILRSDTGQNTIFSLDIDGFGTTDVIFHDRQIDPLKGRLMHADLRRIAKGEKIEVTVPIHIIGEPETEEEGGVVSQNLREIKVFCESNKIPEFIEVDVGALNVNESIHISDLKIGEGVEVHELPETVVVSYLVVKEADLEPTPEDEITEPELVGEESDEKSDDKE